MKKQKKALAIMLAVIIMFSFSITLLNNVVYAVDAITIEFHDATSIDNQTGLITIPVTINGQVTNYKLQLLINDVAYTNYNERKQATIPSAELAKAKLSITDGSYDNLQADIAGTMLNIDEYGMMNLAALANFENAGPHMFALSQKANNNNNNNGSNVNIDISFRDNYSVEQGKVQYSIDSGTTWNDVTANIKLENVVIENGKDLFIKIIANQGYVLDLSGISYDEDGTIYSFNNNENGAIIGAMTGNNGYQVGSSIRNIKLENIEYREDRGASNPIGNSANYTLVWETNGKLCYHSFENLAAWGTGDINYIKLSEITDQSGNNGSFKDNSFFGWVATVDLFDNNGNVKQDLLKYTDRAAALGVTDRSLTDLILFGIDPPKVAELLGINIDGMDERDVDAAIAGHEVTRIGIQQLNFGEGKNSISSNVDNNFLVIIYDEANYAAAYVSENPDDYDYFPEFWMNNTYNANIDISGTTEENPAYIEAYLLNETVTFRNSEVTDEFVNVTPLNVNQNAVQVINKGNGVFEVKFKSNYYDRVKFKIETATKTYYVVIARTCIQVKDNFRPGEENPQLIAEVYYPTEGYDENSFQVVATVTYKNGSKKIFVKDAIDVLEDRWDVDVAEWGKSRGKKVPAGYNDKLSLSRFAIDVGKGEVAGAYFTVIKKGATTSDSYKGTFAGSGVGSYYNLETRRVDYSK